MRVERYMYERVFAMGPEDFLEAKSGRARCRGSLQVMPIARAFARLVSRRPGWGREDAIDVTLQRQGSGKVGSWWAQIAESSGRGRSVGEGEIVHKWKARTQERMKQA